MEIGCGTGVTGTIASKILKCKYIFTDYHISTLEQARENARLNDISEEASEYMRLDILADTSPPNVDSIVGADILYDEDLCKGLVSFLSNRCQNGFKQAFIMSTIRTGSTYSKFKDTLEKCMGLKWSVVCRKPMSGWIAAAHETSGKDWGNFLDSATRFFDVDIELVRIEPVA